MTGRDDETKEAEISAIADSDPRRLAALTYALVRDIKHDQNELRATMDDVRRDLGQHLVDDANSQSEIRSQLAQLRATVEPVADLAKTSRVTADAALRLASENKVSVDGVDDRVSKLELAVDGQPDADDDKPSGLKAKHQDLARRAITTGDLWKLGLGLLGSIESIHWLVEWIIAKKG